MTTNTQNSTNIKQLIDAQENELKELLSRVMTNPLQPLKEQAAQLENRLRNVEDITKATSEINLPALQSAIRQQSEEIKKDFKSLRNSISNDIPELLTACLEAMPQEVKQLLVSQASITDLLSAVQQKQILQGKLAGDAVLQSEAMLLKSLAEMNKLNDSTIAATQVYEKAITRIDESREHIVKNLDGIQADGRLGMQQLGNGMTALAGSLNRTSTQVTDLEPTLARRTDELASLLEDGLTSFRKQSEKDRNELSSALQVMQRRFFWLSVLCSLSFAGSVGLVVSRFILHV